MDEELVKKMFDMGATWQEIGDAVGKSGNAVRMWVRRQDWYDATARPKVSSNLTDTIKVKRSEGKFYTADELLRLHGFDPRVFDIKQAKSNEWTMSDKYNYQSTLNVVPKSVETIISDNLTDVLKDIKPLEPASRVAETKNDYLLIPLFDLHFGQEGNEHMTLLKDIKKILANGYKDVVIVVGGDFLHYDNFKKTTEKGTFVDGVELKTAVKTALEFLVSLLDVVQKKALHSKVIFLKGNHAPSNDFVIIETLNFMMSETKIEFDTSDVETKTFTLGGNYIAVHHGDKATPKRIVSSLIAKDISKMSACTSRYLVTGHLHNEKTISDFGFTHYQVSSPSKPSKYEKDLSFDSSESNQMIFEFDEHKRSAIYYL